MEIGVRLGAACVMTAAGAWGGRLLAGTQARRAAALQDALTGVKRLRVEMLEKRLPLREAMERCGGRIYGEAAARMADGLAPGAACERAAAAMRERGGALDCLTEGDMAALLRLFEGLGAGGMGNQRVLLAEAEEELGRLLCQARKRREEQGKLYASLGAMGGLALALLLM